MKSNEDPFLIGWDKNNWLSDRYFHGSIDEILLYNRILSDEEVKKLYENGFFGIVGNEQVCQGQYGEAYNLAGMDEMTDFQWTYYGNGCDNIRNFEKRFGGLRRQCYKRKSGRSWEKCKE